MGIHVHAACRIRSRDFRFEIRVTQATAAAAPSRVQTFMDALGTLNLGVPGSHPAEMPPAAFETAISSSRSRPFVLSGCVWTNHFPTGSTRESGKRQRGPIPPQEIQRNPARGSEDRFPTGNAKVPSKRQRRPSPHRKFKGIWQ